MVALTKLASRGRKQASSCLVRPNTPTSVYKRPLDNFTRHAIMYKIISFLHQTENQFTLPLAWCPLTHLCRPLDNFIRHAIMYKNISFLRKTENQFALLRACLFKIRNASTWQGSVLRSCKFSRYFQEFLENK